MLLLPQYAGSGAFGDVPVRKKATPPPDPRLLRVGDRRILDGSVYVVDMVDECRARLIPEAKRTTTFLVKYKTLYRKVNGIRRKVKVPLETPVLQTREERGKPETVSRNAILPMAPPKEDNAGPGRTNCTDPVERSAPKKARRKGQHLERDTGPVPRKARRVGNGKDVRQKG